MSTDAWTPPLDVPRAAFLPDLFWAHDLDTGKSVAVDRSTQPDAWASYACADVPLVTQWDDGRHEGTAPGRVPTSSASMPSVVASMMRDLDVYGGMRVLEIGTGTGWSTALLAKQVGESGTVVSLEVDPAVADAARHAVARAGHGGTVVVADGAAGFPDKAPYDRVIATCGLRSVPYPWVGQCAPGGLIVVPWGTPFTHADAVARLVVADDGKSASGAFTGPVEFMKMRSQRGAEIEHTEYVTGSVGEGDTSTTTLTEDDLFSGKFGTAQFALGLRLTRCVMRPATKVNGARPVWLYSLTDRSWAVAMMQDGVSHASVWQYGARRLWDELTDAFAWWAERGRPDHTRFGLTVTAEGEHAWLDSPDTLVTS